MTRVIQTLFTISMLFVSSVLLYAQAIPPDQLYLGQTPPVNIPQIFNVSVTRGLRPVERIAITSDGKEIYYGELNTYPPTIQKVKCYKYLDNKWQGPFIVFNGYASPRLSANDSTMYIQTNINDFSTTYYSKKFITGWSTPIRLISTEQQTHYFQTTGLNNSYLSSNLPSSPSQRDICRLIINNSDTIIQSLGLPINTKYDENDLFVADDESYLLFSRNSAKGGDIFISFKSTNGRWTNPKNLGAPINNSEYSWEYGQFVSKDGKYLFFTSGGATMDSYNTYWIKIDNIIDSLKHTNFIPYLNNQIPSQSIKVGNVFKYTVPDSTFIDDDGNNMLTYSATLSDGNPLPAWLSFDSLTRTFSGTPTSVSNISVRLSANDSGNVNVSCTFDINITIVNATEKTTEPLPKTFNLYQNFPNPFNPTTTIYYTLPKDGIVVLKVYNVLGEEVATLLNNYKETGRYSVEFSSTGGFASGGNAKSLSSGVYFYKLTSDKISIVKKMIVMK